MSEYDYDLDPEAVASHQQAIIVARKARMDLEEAEAALTYAHMYRVIKTRSPVPLDPSEWDRLYAATQASEAKIHLADYNDQVTLMDFEAAASRTVYETAIIVCDKAIEEADNILNTAKAAHENATNAAYDTYDIASDRYHSEDAGPEKTAYIKACTDFDKACYTYDSYRESKQ